MTDPQQIKPQPGPQEAFLATSADIAFYGGAAFGGKTFALLLEAVRHTDNPGFGGVIFRRTTKQVTAEGGLWDTAEEIYPQLGAVSNQSRLQWKFQAGSALTFAHLEHEKNKLDWQGSQICFIGFDEVTHFSEGQFWYMLSRNRSTCGVRPYVRATCNPDPDSFVAALIAWWINQDTGLAIPERSGVVRFFIRKHGELIWADTAEELRQAHPGSQPKSFTFVASSYADNKIGMERDPGYLANLEALPQVERERLKAGNWKVRPSSGDYFKRSYFEIVPAAPMVAQRLRYWDRAATEPSESNPDPDWTAGLRLALADDGYYYVEHVERFRGTPGKVLKRVCTTTAQDGRTVAVGIEQDPAQAGKFEAATYVSALAGYIVMPVPPQGDKETRASPASVQAEHGKIRLVRGPWNEAFLAELEAFPRGAHDDQVDALSGAFNLLTGNVRVPIEYMSTGPRLTVHAGDLIGRGFGDTGFGSVPGGNDFGGFA